MPASLDRDSIGIIASFLPTLAAKLPLLRVWREARCHTPRWLKEEVIRVRDELSQLKQALSCIDPSGGGGGGSFGIALSSSRPGWDSLDVLVGNRW